LDDHHIPSETELQTGDQERAADEDVSFPPRIAEFLGVHPDIPLELAWDGFLSKFGDLLHRTAKYAHRRHGTPEDSHDTAMDAYTFVLEKLRNDDFKRLRAFSGGDQEAFSRWLVVVARRLCTDFWRHRYGRVRPTTSELDRNARRRLVDEIWDPRESSEFPAGKTSDPEWALRIAQRREALEEGVRSLEPREQLLLAYRFEEGLSARRISELMEYPTPFHVYRKLNRVLAGLKNWMEGVGFDDPDP
jgi:RNA polymerase sigma factor (sigma-70 family)